MTKTLALGFALMFVSLETALAQYAKWAHSGSIWILTTPEGADLPATARKRTSLAGAARPGTFDFSQARAHGEDIRFTDGNGTPLAYQIEQWDAAKGTASIWVRIPAIKGNARQEIKSALGQGRRRRASPAARRCSTSRMDISSVLHMSDAQDPVKDEVGTVSPTDAGTTACAGVIGEGPALRRRQGNHLRREDHRLTRPAPAPTPRKPGSGPSRPNATVVAWGNEQAQGKVMMQFASPPHVSMDCYFSGGNVAGESRAARCRSGSTWSIPTRQGDSRLYVNGRLDGVTDIAPALRWRSRARRGCGSAAGTTTTDFVGDIDEVRISKVARSADWVKLEYENQKPLQTLVGPLVQPGNAFSVSPARDRRCRRARARPSPPRPAAPRRSIGSSSGTARRPSSPWTASRTRSTPAA